mmetsp:Transcript_5166/g.9812  ORF Transcript_5166/g.9812 Transcript_5166/m.9812 type:complete len:226 (+) Transcript_5166:78-755(+)
MIRIGSTVRLRIFHWALKHLFGKKLAGGVSVAGARINTNSFEAPEAMGPSAAAEMSERTTRRPQSLACFSVTSSHGGSPSAGGSTTSELSPRCIWQAIFGRAGDAPRTSSRSVALHAARVSERTLEKMASAERTNCSRRRLRVRLRRARTAPCDSASASSSCTVRSMSSYGPGDWFWKYNTNFATSRKMTAARTASTARTGKFTDTSISEMSFHVNTFPAMETSE